jgi:ATP-dependent DNA helicase RecG
MLGVSESRNKNLAACFYRLKLIESYGTGIQRIYESYLKYNVKPEFKISENAFVAILPNVNFKTDSEDNNEKVINIIKNRRNVSRKDIQNELNLSKSTTTLILNKLLEEGKIEQKGKARNTRYCIKNNI